jgi:3D (Asp-Asp-Asp) domain-containing protein
VLFAWSGPHGRLEKKGLKALKNDYKDLQSQIAGDLTAAATSASLAGGSKTRKVSIVKSELPSIIPTGSRVSLESVAFGKLSMGDIICVNMGSSPQVRRFIRLKMTQSSTVLITAYEGFSQKEALPTTSLVGRVVQVDANGKTWDPSKENPLSRFWHKLTEYGTHKPFGLG